MIRADTIKDKGILEVELEGTGAEILAELTALTEGVVKSAHSQAPKAATIEELLQATISHVYKVAHNNLCGGTIVTDTEGACRR